MVLDLFHTVIHTRTAREPIVKVLLLLLALAASPSVQGAETLRICTDEKSHLPFIDPAGGGVAGQLIRQAAAELGLHIVFYPAPTTRCREEMRVGVADAFPITPYTTSLLGIAAYPMSKGKPDPERAVLVARSFAYRRTGTAVDWDGKKFIRLTTPVLMPFGAVLLNDRLKAAGVAYDDKGKTLDLIFSKLLAERGDIAVGAEYSGMALLADPRFAGKIEMLPIPFTTEPYFLAVTQKVFDRDPALVQKLWDTIGRIRASPDYQAYYDKTLRETKAE